VQSYKEVDALPNYAQNKNFTIQATVPQHFMLSHFLLIYKHKKK
jgi:hypothetical protein